MSLGVIARFSTLSEAQVACGALRSAGFHAEVFDQTFGTMVWTDQVALGGFRLMAPDEELAAAAAYLAEVQRAAPEPEAKPSNRPADGAWGAAAAVSALTVGVDFSWLLLGLRDRLKRGGLLSVLVTAAAMVVMLMFAAAMLALVIAALEGRLAHRPV